MPRKAATKVEESSYGFCPFCGAPGVLRERRPNGNDQCAKGHTYPSASAVMPKAKRSKYRNVRTEHNGVLYASKAEAGYAASLDRQVAWGHLHFWVGQPKFRLGCPENVYVPDFLVVGRGGAVHVVDVKGAETAKFRKDKRLWLKYGPCDLYVIKGKKIEVIRPENGRKQGGSD